MRFSHIVQVEFITCFVRKHIHSPEHEILRTLLREIRIEAGLTQIQLAERLNGDQTIVSKYETGERRIDILELRDVCEAVGISLNQFIRKLEKALKQSSS